MRSIAPPAFTIHAMSMALLFAWAPEPALAQNPPVREAPTKDAPAPGFAKPQPPSNATLSAAMEATLRKAGFSELQILPNSVLVRAKDKAGNPVAMVLNPDSMTEVVTLDPHSGTAAGGNGSAAPLTGSATFATVLPSERLASRLIGTAVSNKGGEALGTIRDVAIDHGGLHAYIIRVAGLLGIGERYAAVTPAAVTLTLDPASGKLRASIDATPEQMKAAPEFKYRDLDEARQ